MTARCPGSGRCAGRTCSERQDGVRVSQSLLELLVLLRRDFLEHPQVGFSGRKDWELVAGGQSLCWVPEAEELGFVFVKASPFCPLRSPFGVSGSELSVYSLLGAMLGRGP